MEIIQQEGFTVIKHEAYVYPSYGMPWKTTMRGVVIDETVYILFPSSSSYKMWIYGRTFSFVCIDSCCRADIHDIEPIVQQAKTMGVNMVVLRSKRDFSDFKIADVPVSNVADHLHWPLLTSIAIVKS